MFLKFFGDATFHWSSVFFANGRLINLPISNRQVELLWNANPKNQKKEIEKIHTSSLKSKQIQPSAFGVGIGFVLTFGNRYGFFNLPFSNSLDFPNLTFSHSLDFPTLISPSLLFSDISCSHFGGKKDKKKHLSPENSRIQK